ncbi:hypothetical protein [Metallosphaera hakonensis]|uniref:hypothetical protein n=1 Tax=Metallosphaera hakonensis TaxID=79601 RepID=UPI0006CF3BE8|nr:hypothetical protein [Metallosphaera hakonensis]
MIAVNTLSQVHDAEPFKSLYEKYHGELKGIDELRDKDPALYASYLFHRMFDDYLNNGKLKGLLDEISKIKLDKKRMISLMGVKDKVEAENVVESLSYTVWTFETSNPLDLLKKLDSSIDRDIEIGYMGLKVYLVVKPSPDELGSYESYIFFTKNNPRIGVEVGEISIDPYEVTIVLFDEGMKSLMLSIIEKKFLVNRP